jgi:hypothetical protein
MKAIINITEPVNLTNFKYIVSQRTFSVPSLGIVSKQWRLFKWENNEYIPIVGTTEPDKVKATEILMRDADKGCVIPVI